MEDYKMSIDFKKYIASVKDFPNEGIIFRDITPILQDGEAFAAATHEIAEYAKSRQADVIVGPEARGFLVGTPVAIELVSASCQPVSPTSCHGK